MPEKNLELLMSLAKIMPLTPNQLGGLGHGGIH